MGEKRKKGERAGRREKKKSHGLTSGQVEEQA